MISTQTILLVGFASAQLTDLQTTKSAFLSSYAIRELSDRKQIIELIKQDGTIQVVVVSGQPLEEGVVDQIRIVNQEIEVLAVGQDACSPEWLRIILENAVKLAAERRNVKIISYLAALLHNAETPKEIMQSTCQAVIRLFDVDHSGFVEFDDNGLHGWKVSEYPEISPSREFIQVQGVAAEEQIVLKGMYFMSDHVPDDVRLGVVRTHLTSKGIQSILIMPVRAGTRVIGSFSLDIISKRRLFSVEEINLAKLLADLAGAALNNFRRRDEADALRCSLNVLNEVARKSTKGNLRDVLQSIVDLAHSRMQVDVATLYTYDHLQKRFDLDVGAGDHPGTRASPGQIEITSSLYRLLQLPPSKSYDYTEDSGSHPTFSGGFVTQEEIRSSFGMPLYYETEPVGVMFINFRTIHHFKEDELRTFEQFGNQAAVIIKATQLKSQLRKQLTALESLYRAEDFDLENHDLEKSLARIAHLALSVVGVNGEKVVDGISHVALLKGACVQFVAASTPEVLDGLRNRVGLIDLRQTDKLIGIVGRAIQNKRTINIGDIKNNADYIEYGPDINSQISVLLKVGDRVYGALSVESSEKNAFTSEAEKNLEHLARHAEMAILNSRHLMLINGLLNAGNPLISGKGLKESLHSIGELLQELFGCDLVSIYTYNGETDEISYPSIVTGKLLFPECQANSDLTSLSGRLSMKQLKNNSVLLALKNNLVSIYRSSEAEKDPVLGQGAFTRRERICAVAAIPLIISAKQLVGFLFLNFRQEHAFSETDVKEINVFGQTIAHVIDYYRQFDDIKTETGLVGSLNALEWMNLFAEKRDAQIREHIREIQGNVALISQQLRQMDRPDHDRILQDGITKIKAITNLISKSLGSPLLQPGRAVRLDRLLTELLNQPDHQDGFSVKIKCQKMKAGSIWANPNWLRHGFNQLLDYLRESAESTSEYHLEAEIGRKDERIVVILRDDGLHVSPCGVGKSTLRALQDVRDAPVRLMVAQSIFMLYEGNLECQPNLPRGVTFTISFPEHPEKKEKQHQTV